MKGGNAYLMAHVETTVATMHEVERAAAILAVVREKGWEVEEALMDSG